MHREGSTAALAVEGLVVFALGGSEYAVPTSQVREVLRMVAITPIPGAPTWLPGIINLRGRVAPVVDLRERLGVAAAPIGLSTPILVVDADEMVVGLIADRVDGMVEVPADALVGGGEAAPFLRGVAHLSGRLVLIADTGAVCEGVAAFLPADV